MDKKAMLVLALCLVLCFASIAGATSLLDYSTIATALTTEISDGVPAFVAVIGLVIGIPLVLRLVKRIVR